MGLGIGETSKFTGCSFHIQQPAAANLYRKSYTYMLNAAASWLQPAVMNVDVSPKYYNRREYCGPNTASSVFLFLITRLPCCHHLALISITRPVWSAHRWVPFSPYVMACPCGTGRRARHTISTDRPSWSPRLGGLDLWDGRNTWCQLVGVLLFGHASPDVGKEKQVVGGAGATATGGPLTGGPHVACQF